jgi:chromosome segregation ATPase
MAQSDLVRSVLLKREEIDSKHRMAEENIGRLDRTLSTAQARKEELSKRFAQLKQGLEKSIQEVTGQTIRILD